MFDKKKLAELLLKAIGDRSINQYALECGISSAHISRLTRALLETPPNPETIKKLADKAHNDVTYIDLMNASGHIELQSDQSSKSLAQIKISAESLELAKRIEELDPQSKKFLEDALKMAEQYKKGSNETSATGEEKEETTAS